MVRALGSVLWFSQPLLEAAICWFMLRRDLHRRFPIFFSYLAYLCSVTLVHQAVRYAASYKAYFYVYWSTNAVEAMLAFGVIYEIFRAMFSRHEGLRDFGSVLFQWAGVVVMMMASLVVISNTGGLSQMTAAVTTMSRSVAVMHCSLLLLVLLFSTHLGISLRHHVFGITLGLGLAASVEMILLTQWAKGVFGAFGYNLLHMGAFDATLIIWLTYARLPAPVEVLPNLLLKSQRWSEALVEASLPPSDQTVLLGIESIVERAMTKTNGSAEPIKR